MVLLRGLSPRSATVTAVVSRTEFGRRGEKVNVVKGPKAAQAAFEMLLKPPPGRG